MSDQYRQLAIFAKTIDHGSFRGAAKELRLSPSVVSHHISQLEESLGVALIFRSTRKLRLTQDGQRLLSATRDMLDAVDEAMSELSASAGTPSGSLNITMPSVLSPSILMDRIARFKAAYPNIRLSLDFSDTKHKLVESSFDFAIRMGPNATNSSTTRKLFDVDRKLVASTKFLSNHPAPKAPEDIVEWDWLALVPALEIPLRFTHKSGEEKIIRPDPGVFTNDAQALYRLAAAGGGLAIVPGFLADDDIAVGTVKHLMPDWALPPITVSAEWPANAPKHGLIHLALNALS